LICRRSKDFALRTLNKHLGNFKIHQLTRAAVIEFGKKRAKEGAGPATLSADISYIHTVLTHAAAIHGLPISTEQVDLARVALRRLGLIGRSNQRNRRPTQQELDRLISYFENFATTSLPIARIVKFAVATGMRQSEICRIEWSDVDARTRCVTVRDRKDPRHKQGNDQRVPMINLTGYDAWELLEEQRYASTVTGRIFPYNSRTVGTIYRRGRDKLGISDLKFHDFRHEATSRLFEAGLTIEKVALVTGHKDWKMLKRYTHLDPAVVFAEYRPRETTNFDEDSNIIRMTQALGETTEFAYDEVDRLLSSVDAKGQLRAFAYDLPDNIAGITDARANISLITYDELDRPRTRSNPKTETWTF